jgi:hypothetical protein
MKLLVSNNEVLPSSPSDALYAYEHGLATLP